MKAFGEEGRACWQSQKGIVSGNMVSVALLLPDNLCE
jgi:hypothetical protein